MNGKEVKELLREETLEKRGRLSADEIMEKSEMIRLHLFAAGEFRKARYVLYYYSVDSEVNTHRMIQESLLRNQRVLLPRCIMQERMITVHLISDVDTELEKGPYGIPEPKPDVARVDLQKIDCIIVPGIVFDRCGNRVGHGKGYYDNFLRATRKEGRTYRIGISFSMQLVAQIPSDEHDEKVDKIITEEGVVYTADNDRKEFSSECLEIETRCKGGEDH